MTENTTEYESDLVTQRKLPEPERPNTSVALGVMFQAYLDKHHRAPAGLSYNPKEAARQWVSLQDPPSKTEKPELRERRDRSGGKYWHTPYLDRLKRNLGIFLSLSSEDQQFIVDATVHHRLRWRGEPMPAYRQLFNLTVRTEK